MISFPIYIYVWLNSAFVWSLFFGGIRDITGSNLKTNNDYPEIYDFNPSHQTCAEIMMRN
jgi:hypothetical protein